MKVGDLVRRKDTIDPRIGIVRDTEADYDGRVLTTVLWHTGQVGNYFAEHLEEL